MLDDEYAEIYDKLENIELRLTNIVRILQLVHPEINQKLRPEFYHSGSGFFIRPNPCQCRMLTPYSSLNTRIQTLLHTYQNDFIKEFSKWSEDDISFLVKHAPESFRAYRETGLLCSRDITTSSHYDQELKHILNGLIEHYTWERVVMTICKEAKNMEVFN